MKTIKPIRTKREHDAALKRVEALWNAKRGTAAYDELEVLSILIEHYETIHYPVPSADPITAMEFRMEQMGLSRSDLAPLIGNRARVSEVLSKKRPLTLRMIRNLHKTLGIPAEVLIQKAA